MGGRRAAMWALLAGVQLPGIAAVAVLTGSWALAVAIAALLTAPYLPQMAQPWHPPPMSRLWRLALLVFFAWWGACLAGWLLAPFVLLVATVAGASGHTAALIASGLSLAAGLRGLWPHPRVVRRTISSPVCPPPSIATAWCS